MKQQGPTSKLWAGLKHAFTIPEDKPLSQQEQRWLELIAERVVKRRLAAPAILLLQSAKPMNFVASQLLVFFKPVISVVFPPGKCDEVAELISRRQSAEALLRMIEEKTKHVGKGKYGRVIKMARKPTGDEYLKVTQITSIGLLLIGGLGFLIYWIFEYGSKLLINAFK
jgi:protein transport protein SEC61 subunit gamma-like protein